MIPALARAHQRASRRRLIAISLLLGVLLIVWVALAARDAVRQAWVKSWVLQAEELGAFATGALASQSDLLLVKRMVKIARRDEVVYALIMDPSGRAAFHSNVAEVGRRYTSVFTKRALATSTTLVQDIASQGVIEVDVPLNRGVLRVGFTFKPLAVFFRWLWAGVALSCGLLALAGLPLLRAS